MPLADRNAGYAPQTIVLKDRHEVGVAASWWLDVLLGFHGRERHWALYDPEGTGVRLEVVKWNTTLRDPGDVAAAQQWATLFVEASDLLRQEQAAAGTGWLTVPAAPARVTEWRAVLFAGRSFYAPLFNVSSLCMLPVRDVLPATGADCACLSVEDAGDGAP
ncbi:hypothetical protein QLQ12_37790 [Actinoplanes sp. NEAU-A12]|uniref:Uncharacterized protein n=1 Tax=Actinoplanes sandaracinus TaxID=3045177 RepID=A0ABT6WXD5_9ACTN|nr:hypothetical protein [Actinoplanes sandaracinus]MDI6104359.1 hypothetical protein [Actinoplanes sandaracinus]